jgi:hypothetical protein
MRPHPASCCCELCLQEIEAQFDGSQPYYVPALIAALRASMLREQHWRALAELWLQRDKEVA